MAPTHRHTHWFYYPHSPEKLISSSFLFEWLTVSGDKWSGAVHQGCVFFFFFQVLILNWNENTTHADDPGGFSPLRPCASVSTKGGRGVILFFFLPLFCRNRPVANPNKQPIDGSIPHQCNFICSNVANVRYRHVAAASHPHQRTRYRHPSNNAKRFFRKRTVDSSSFQALVFFCFFSPSKCLRATSDAIKNSHTLTKQCFEVAELPSASKHSTPLNRLTQMYQK